MITPELIAFVKSELASGATKDTIITKMKASGWADEDVVEAFAGIASATTIETGKPVMSGPVTFPVIASRKKKIMKLELFILLPLIVIVGAGLAYASGYIVPLESIFTQSTNASRENTSVAFGMHLTVDTSKMKSSEDLSKSLPGLSPVFNLDAKGAYDALDPKNTKTTGSFTISSGTIVASFDVREVGDALYVSLTKAPNIGIISLEPFKDRWITLPKNGAGSLANNPLVPAAGADSQLFSTLTDAQKKHITDMISKASLIKITDKHLPQIVDGSMSFHFDFDLDRPGIVAFVKEFITYIQTIDKTKSESFDVSNSDLDKAMNTIKDFHGEAWIGVFDKLPHKITTNFTILDPENASDGSAIFAMDLTYSDWNKQVLVEAPKDATTIDKLMGEVMGGMFGGVGQSKSEETSMQSQALQQAEGQSMGATLPVSGMSSMAEARNKGLDAKTKTILSSMRAQGELFYDMNKNTYKGFCRDKTNGANRSDLAISLPPNSQYKCNDAGTSWAAGANLWTIGYWCVDSSGTSKNSTSLPTTTSCPK